MTIPYVTGTVSVTAGSAVVTGSGTAWATALIAGGLFGLDSSNGNPVPILSVDSNTQLTLAKPWRGTTAAGQGYWIVRDTAYLQQQTVNAQALSTYIQRLDNAALAALASLTPEADKLFYYTGAGTAVLIDLKAKGREILGSADTLALLDKLGPVFGGPAPTPASAGVGLVDGDFNTITNPGVYTIAGNWLNGPANTGPGYTGILEVQARGFANLYMQTLRYGVTGLAWRRFTNVSGGQSWPNPWFIVENQTVGTVAAGAGGQPTGAIMERGSNANGEYVKFADGTMICTSPLISGININVAAGALFRSEPFISATFPATFATIPCGFGHVSSTVNAWISPRALSTTGWGTYAWSPNSRTNDSVILGAVGRWF